MGLTLWATSSSFSCWTITRRIAGQRRWVLKPGIRRKRRWADGNPKLENERDSGDGDEGVEVVVGELVFEEEGDDVVLVQIAGDVEIAICRVAVAKQAGLPRRFEALSEKGDRRCNPSFRKPVTFNGSFDHMNIDATSVQNLEIIDPLHSTLWGTSNKKRSLFHMLKTTRTIGGYVENPINNAAISTISAVSFKCCSIQFRLIRHLIFCRTRLLRANLLQPLKDIETINTRLDCLDELMSNEQLFFGLSQVLRKFPKETDRVLCHFCFKPKKVTNEVLGIDNARKSQILISSIILLKTALDAMPLLLKVLKDANSFLLGNVYRSVCENEKYASIRKRIGEVIDEDVLHARVPFVAQTQQCFAVKAGIDGLLDIARRSFCDISEAIHKLANQYREDFKVPNLKIPFNKRQGFYFSIPQKDIQGKVPSKFIQVVKEIFFCFIYIYPEPAHALSRTERAHKRNNWCGGQ
ncbi:hypothetical protein HYC85_026727 [Camellia sinensis]|uniref:DNA mismatch repair protein MutS core domain-containing protein n=1 Tax=Camellia sinensis TaxID=4442 RepID=A0A7J7G824_CAMSI|nr:hypothetical protein HYC85_026727 [Camellia sinensis]